MATRALNRQDVDRLFKGVTAAIISLGVGMFLLVAAAISGSGIFNLIGYAALLFAFLSLAWMSWPAFK
ncbi:hypothetical protein CK500_09165 [Halorubrum salipaludis]|uniref:Uncharacterized protein n=1 Tax=Halorubrum salipaludis TaxID=2032630 RepID=A0A2A2FG97_9EURY|nr:MULTISPECIES: hypothetical protein [Halorubrum]PAU83672.1 hypothetical protein CK500_09165 [Halorubrum salipaludis]